MYKSLNPDPQKKLCTHNSSSYATGQCKYISCFTISKQIFFLFVFISHLLPISSQAQESIYTAPAATFYTHPNAQVGVFGNIINDATGGLNHNNGGDVYLFRSAATGSGNSRIYDGPSAPAFTGNYNTGGAFVRFYNLITDNSIGTNTPSGTLINNSNGQGHIQIEQEVRISNLHTFSNGMVWTPRGNWKHAFVHYDANGASYTGNNNSKHVDGYTAKTGNSNFDFPIGDGIYQRISGLISPSNGTYKSAYFKKNPKAGTFGLSGPNAAEGPRRGSLAKISSREFWDIDGTGTSQFKITALNSVAGYSDWATDFSSYSASDVRFAAWDATWENLGNNLLPLSFSVDGSFISSANPTNPDNGNVFGTGSPFSAYTWGAALYSNVLSVNLLHFSGTSVECKASFSWSTKDEVNADRFELEQSVTGFDYSLSEIILAKNVTGQNFYSVTISQAEPIVSYRLKIIDKNGKYNYSKVEQVKVDCNDEVNFSVYPNPVRSGNLFINYWSATTDILNIVLFNELGQQIMKKEAKIKPESNRLLLNVSALPKGNYIIHLTANNKKDGVTQKIYIE